MRRRSMTALTDDAPGHPLNPVATDGDGRYVDGARDSFVARWERIIKQMPSSRTSAAARRIADADNIKETAQRLRAHLLTLGHALSDQEAIEAVKVVRG